MKRYGILFVSMLCMCAVGAFGGCRTVRNIAEETTTQSFSEYSSDSALSTAATAEKTTETRSDSSNVLADERGRVEIERDSAGRPVVLIWNLDWRLQGNNTMQTEKGRWFYGLNATRHSEASGETGTVSKKKEETETVVDPSIPLDAILDVSLKGLLVLLLAIYLIIDFLYPWIKKHRR